MATKTPITVAHGDGIGPEILAATLEILSAAGAALEIETIEVGEKVYLRGNSAGIEPAGWESLRRTRVFLKGPTTTPPGGGYKSLNVTTRKTLGLFANVRPCVSYAPFIETAHPAMDVVIVRENEEDLYSGIEYQLSAEVCESLKLISRPGSEKIIRYAFDYARQHNRRKVSCFTKDNILKMTDGLFHKVFDEVAAEYSELQSEHWLVDLGAAKLADNPEAFDVIVMPNLYGDILSDVAAQIAGSVGLAGSANIGDQCAMFEPVHGPSTRWARQNLANPSGMLLSAVLMLVHIGQSEVAAAVHNAWLRTIEDGIHTYDIYSDGASTRKAGTSEFARAVKDRLGKKPNTLQSVSYRGEGRQAPIRVTPQPEPKIDLVGVDVYVDWPSRDTAQLAAALESVSGAGLRLELISNRGVKVWPGGLPETFCTDNYRCRFAVEHGSATQLQIVTLLQQIAASGIQMSKTENLRWFDGQPGFSLTLG